MGLFDKVIKGAKDTVKKVGDKVGEGVAGVEDVVVGVATGDVDKIKQGASDIGEAALAVSTFGQSVILEDVLGDLGPGKDKSAPIASKLREQQQVLADVQRDESIRQQEEQATVARRNIFRQQVAENLATQQAQASASLGAGRFGSSFAQQATASVSQQAAKTAFGAQFGMSEVDRQLAANIGFITRTSELGRDISNLSQALAVSEQQKQQQAQGIAGIIQGGVSGASVGATFGPQGAIVGGVIGAATGGFSSGAFQL